MPPDSFWDIPKHPESLSEGLSSTYYYRNPEGTVSLCYISNEPGHHANVNDFGPRIQPNGVVIGAGGGVLDWAKAARAQKALIVDGNPVMRDAVHFVIAVLLVVDKLGTSEGWDWPLIMTHAELFITNAGSRKLISQELGVQFDEKLADDVCGRFTAFAISWSSETDAIGRFKHLTRMAFYGPIVVATRDLSSPRAIAVINRQLADWQLTISHLHLTNVLDYVPNVAEVMLMAYYSLLTNGFPINRL